jgi:hypothetical protein
VFRDVTQAMSILTGGQGAARSGLKAHMDNSRSGLIACGAIFDRFAGWWKDGRRAT